MKIKISIFYITLIAVVTAPLNFSMPDSIYSKVGRDSVTIFHDRTVRNCASSFLIEYERNGFELKIIEYDTSTVRNKCTCSYDLSVTIGQLNPGTYTAYITSIDLLLEDTADYGIVTFTIDAEETGKLSEMQSDCYFAPEKASPNTPSDFYPWKDSLYAEVNGYYVKLRHDHLVQNCASRFIISYEMDSNYIKVIELDTTMFRYDCICEYDLMLELGPLDPGIYTAEYIGRGVLEADSFSYGKINFDIKNPEAGALKLSQYQSSCKPLVAVPEEITNAIPESYLLYPAYPNPFNPSTIIRYSLPEPGYIRITIYDILGCEVCTIVDEYKSAGSYEAEFNGTSLTSGTYICRMQAGRFSSEVKLLLIK